jgi:hypothetical protein
MAAKDPKAFVQSLRETYAETISDRRFVYPEWFKGTGEKLREAYRQLACAYWASSEVHAKAQSRFEWVLDIDTKIKIARQVWEEARHCKDVQVLLKEAFRENFEVENYEPVQELTDCFYNYYGTIDDPGGYFAAHNAAGERTALHMLEEAAAYARAGGMTSLARFAERIIPEERLHVRLGEEVVAMHAKTEQDQKKLETYFKDGLEAHWNYTEGVYRKIAGIEG